MAQSETGVAYYASRILLTLVAAVTAIGPYAADWNESHIYNPTWPGHARFHNGQTMSMGVFLGMTTLWKTWFDNNDNLLTASVLASGYYITMLSAWYYPGSTGYDPPQTAQVEFPQLFVLGPNLALIGVAYSLEQWRSLSGQVKKTKGKKRA